MGRQLDTTDLRDLLYSNADHSRWEDVAPRCLACGNCTLVCPTCFCTSVDDSTSLVDGTRERWRVWDSCFTGEFTYVARRHRPRVDRVALPPVGDAQAGRLVGPVRRRPAAWGAGAASPGAPRPSTSRRRRCHPRSAAARRWSPRSDMRDIDQRADRAARSSPGSSDADLRPARRLRGQRAGSRGQAASSAKATPPTTFYVVRHGPRGARGARPAGGTVVVDTLEEGEVLGWSWLVPPVPLAVRRPGRDGHGVVVFDGACLRGKCDADPPPGLPAHAAGRARCCDHGCAPRGCGWSTSTGRAGMTAVVAARAAPGPDPMQPRRFDVRERRQETADTVTYGWPRRRPSPGVRCPGSSRCCRRSASARCPSRSAATRAARRPAGAHGARRRRHHQGARPRGPSATGSACAARSAPAGGSSDGEGGDVVIVAGGIGLAPLRPAVLAVLADRERYRRVVLLYGTRRPPTSSTPRSSSGGAGASTSRSSSSTTGRPAGAAGSAW